MRATVNDGQGRAHTSTLYEQLGLAVGIDRAELVPLLANCAAGCSAYDCGGTFFGAAGRSVQVPAFPSSVAPTDAEVRAWKASVSAFYRSAYVDENGRRRLSPGKAALCTTWRETRFSAKPDPSVLQALTDLQQMGAEAQSAVDTAWLRNIVDAGAKQGCPAPTPRATSDGSAWWLPPQYAKSFLSWYRDCAKPDFDGLGGCPHSFDGPRGQGNHVNAQYVTDMQSDRCQCTISWFVADPAGGAGLSTYGR